LRISRLVLLVVAALVGGAGVASAAPRIEVVVTISGLDGVSSLGAGATLTYTARYPSTGTYQAVSVFRAVFADSAQLEITGAASADMDGTYEPVDRPYYAFASTGTVDFPTYSTRTGGIIEFATPEGALTLDIQVPGRPNPPVGAPVSVADFANAPPDSLGTTFVVGPGGSEGTPEVTVSSHYERDPLPVADHVYELAGSYADTFGGPDLVPNGGTLGPTGYTFAAGQGLDLAGAVDPQTYSIELTFRIFDSVDPYTKLLDFADLGSDQGLYVYGSGLALYSAAAGGPGAFATNRTATVLLTREGTTGTVRGFVDGALQLSASDPGGTYVFSGPDAVMHFFRDDSATVNENAAGFVDRIRIWNWALPEPGSASGAAAAVFGLVLLARHRAARLRGRAARAASAATAHAPPPPSGSGSCSERSSA
jgi:hypothetical protein